MTKPAKGSAALRGCTVLSLMLSTLLQAAFGDIWLLSLVVLGSASIRRVLIPALIGLFGPRMPSDGVGERTPLFYFRRACQVHFCEAMIRILGLLRIAHPE